MPAKKPTAKTVVKKPAAKKTVAAKKPAAKTAVKKPAAKTAQTKAPTEPVIKTKSTKATAKKPAAKKTVAAKPKATTAKKPAAKKTVAAKAVAPAAKKKSTKAPTQPTAKKTVSKKPAAKVAVKVTPKKSTAKKSTAKKTKPTVASNPNAPTRVVITPRSVAIAMGGKTLMMDQSHKDFAETLEAVKAQDWSKACGLLSPIQGIKKLVEDFKVSGVEVTVNSVMVDGIVLSGKLATRLREALSSGDESNLTALANFARRCQANPSFRVVSRVFDFLQANDIRIASDGRFLAWKVVRDNFMDLHSNTMSNAVGLIVEMPRNQVQDDDRITCSNGLHICSASYLNHYGTASGNRVVLCAVDPADVVSVPNDYHDAKMRTCRYEVIKDCGSRGSFKHQDHI